MAVDSTTVHSSISAAAEAAIPLLAPMVEVISNLATSEDAASNLSTFTFSNGPGNIAGATNDSASCTQGADAANLPPSASASSQTAQPENVATGSSGDQEVSRRTETADTVAHEDAGVRRRSSILNSGLWIVIELLLTLSQVVAAFFVLLLSSNEKPKAPLGVWVVGYAIGCTATLPLLYWRYLQRCARVRDTRGAASGRSARRSRSRRGDPASTDGIEPHNPLEPPAVRPPVRPQSSRSGERPRGSWLLNLVDENRVVVAMDRFKCTLDIYFAVWFVLGNVWVFGGHVAPSDAPNLYSLCLVFLTLSCIGYAVPFLLCATICLCLPCILALFSLVDEPMLGKGAPAAVISALPTYKYKLKVGEEGQRGVSESASEAGRTGLLWAGTEKERSVAGEDALCCICLGKYSEGEELRELPCTHHFHVSCVDTWLKINANCPLCKSEIETDASKAGGEGQDAAAV